MEEKDKLSNHSELSNDIETDMLNNRLEMPSNLLLGMSHEMRTYMNSIVSFSFLMKYNRYNIDDWEQFNNQILISCEHLIRLFDSFINFMVIRTGNSGSHTKKRTFSVYINSIFSELKELQIKLNHKDVAFLTETCFSDKLELEIATNFEMISEMIRSIFHNAVKNTKSGYIKVGAGIRDQKINIYITDTGEEFEKNKEFLYSDNLNESLSNFYDISSAINIILARKITELLEGTIWIERNDLYGSKICFSIPI